MRLAGPEDAESLTALINTAFRRAEGFFIDEDRIDLESVMHLLETGKFLLAESTELLLGCVYVEQRSGETGGRAYLGLLAVNPNRQRSGIASDLMEIAEDYGREQGACFMDLKVVSLREELLLFYGKRGYVETGTLPFPPEVETLVPCHLIEMSKPL
ncbi:MAG TPA: GNAT family N-acetyltransferase [Pyrinomonadaceae bacterium]|nr:GNAT family N-acetyltransferase [Pyrinomonadaceae bacterium]